MKMKSTGIGKICRSCNEYKLNDLFHKRSNSTTPRGHICKECSSVGIGRLGYEPLRLLENEICKELYYNKDFLITNLGRIISKPISLIKKNGSHYNRGYRVLATSINTGGYKSVKINNHAKSLHTLIARSFIANPDNLPVVNHIDGNKLNNSLNNLEWCTTAENNEHALRLGLKKSISIDCYDLEGNFIKKYERVSNACIELNIADANIYNMINNKKYPKQIKGYIFKKSLPTEEQIPA